MSMTTHRFSQSTPPARGHSPLAWFVVVSLLLHLPLLLTFETPPLTPGAAASPLQLTLSPAPATPANQTPSATETPARHRPARAAVAARAPHPTAAQPAPVESVTATNVAPTAMPLTSSSTLTEDEHRAEQQAVLTIQLQQALARHFSYPLLARKKGWEGEVMLAFRIKPDGTISGARIARGSGYGALDRAALGALRKVGRIDGAPQQGLSLELPVIYRLQEG